MNNRMLGVLWERESRKILKEKFKTNEIFKLINPERIDWIIFYKEEIPKIALVESKFTKKESYYPFENEKKRVQINEYFSRRDNIRGMGLSCDFYMLIKKGSKKEIFFEKIEEIGQIKKKY